jgi:Protein of unknown function (DUF559)/UvrD-like helicase C-terminal domain/UvrD/REP helicase N-terminal domain
MKLSTFLQPLPPAPAFPAPKVAGRKLKIGALCFNKHIATELTSRIAQMTPDSSLPGSPEQEAIWNHLLHGQEHLIVDAKAGTGKTHTLVQGILRLMLEYGADVTAKTYNSFGWSACLKAYRNVQLDDMKIGRIVQDLLEDEYGNQNLKDLLGYNTYAAVLSNTRQLAGLCMNHLYDGRDKQQLETLADLHNIELNGSAAYVLPLVPDVLAACAADTSVMCFADQVWQPVTKKLLVETFDVLFVDECFVGDTPILLADGTTRTIRDLVETRYAGRVRSYQTGQAGEPAEYGGGRSVNARVVGWHRVPVSKRMLRITTRRVAYNDKTGVKYNANLAYVKHGHRFLVCTEDHKLFLPEHGTWAHARTLKVGDVLIEESHAPKVSEYKHKYKIGRNGLAALGATMRAKNDAGTCGTSRRGGHITEKTRGGNGRGPAPVEAALLERLGPPWVWNYTIRTECARGTGYPSCYKVDLANPTEKIALELDGNSHNIPSRKEQDVKKDALLTAKGWTVVRLRNQDAIRMSDDLLHARLANSPVPCEIVAIEEYAPKDPWVYDITVEGTHCYYADGVLVHNCQDTSQDQQELALLACPTGRIVFLGDVNQSIYGFKGSIDAIPRMRTRLAASARGCITLPLTVTRRCPKSHVRLVNSIVPDIKAMEDAPEGVIECMGQDEAGRKMKTGDLVLCRTNAPLVAVAYDLIRRNVKAVIRGRDIGTNLRQLIDKLKAGDSVPNLLSKLSAYRQAELGKLTRLGERAVTKVQALQDRVECIVALTDGVNSVAALKQKIDRIFADFDGDGKPKDAVVLGSVHRTKGLEAATVWILAPQLLPHPMAKQKWEMTQELNLAYVAGTRAKYDNSKSEPGRIVFVQDVKSSGVPAVYARFPAVRSEQEADGAA